jgi:hypothetical protein
MGVGQLAGLFEKLPDRLAPTPTNTSTNSEPEIDRKGTPASVAMALAKRVFPVPGGPTINKAFMMFPRSLSVSPGL